MSEPFDRRFSLDSESVYSDISRILNTTVSACSGNVLAKALGSNAVRKLQDDSERVRRRLHDQFQLVVVGDFKRGKSTLINALLGENIVPTSVTPETVTINRLLYSDAPSTVAVLKNKRRVSLSQEELPREALEELIRQLPAEIDHIDIYRSNELLKELTLVDTPGIGDLMEEFDQQVAEYLVNADAVIYVISARSPLSASEQTFLSSAVMPQSFSRVFLVVNMTDTLETEENVEKMRRVVQDRAGAVSDKIYVHMISALDEYCRKMEKRRPEPDLTKTLEENFLAFESSLKNDLLLQKEIIKTSRGIALTRMVLNYAAARIRLAQHALGEDVSRLDQVGDALQQQDDLLTTQIDARKADLAADIDRMNIEARSWMRDFMERLEAELASSGRTAATQELQRYLQFYLMDKMKAAVGACLQRHQRDISDRINGYSRELSSDLMQNAFGGVQEQISDCIADISWTSADSALFLGETAVSLMGGALASLVNVGYVVAGLFRRHALSQRQDDLVTPVLEAFSSITDQVLGNLDEIYGRLKLDAQLKLDDLYQSQRELSAEAIENARRAAADENLRVQDILQEAEEALQTIEACQKELEAYQ